MPATRRSMRAVLLPLLSVVFIALCAPGRPLAWLAWVAMVPLFVQLGNCGALQAAALCGLFGWLQWMSSAWWLHTPLRDISGFSELAAMLILGAGCALMALPYALSAIVIRKWPVAPGLLGSGRNAAVFTVAITFLTPVFQANLAHTQYRSPVMLQVLDLGGTPLLLFAMLWVNWLLADALFMVCKRRVVFWRLIGIAAALVLAVAGYGFVRVRQIETEMASAPDTRWITVGAIQPNIAISVPPERQPSPLAASNSLFTAFHQAEALVRTHPAIDLLAFPENPEIFIFNQDGPRRRALAHLIEETHTPVMLNVDAIDTTSKTNSRADRYNVVVLVDAGKNIANHYAKIKRVPLVEYVPGETWFPFLKKPFPKTLCVLPGARPEVFEVTPGVRIIPLVCYEATVSSFTRQFVRLGGNIIINQANDSWFLRTPGSEFHFALALFRCVEYRVPMVRVTNSGFGAHIQATGKIVPGSRTKLFTEEAKAFALYVPPQRSLYAATGDYWMVALGGLLWRPRMRKVRQLCP